jgi:hypothetical protein
MSDASTKILADRIGAIIERVKVLADERDAYRHESEAAARLRTVISDAVRELRQE